MSTGSEDPRLTVCLSFDFDAMSVWINTVKSNNPTEIARGEYGAYVIPRILAMLSEAGVRATFFIPGHTALAYPDLVRRIDAAGHEIGHHGWVHENPIDLDHATERAVFEKGLQALDQVAGVRPRGWRSPGTSWSVHTHEVLLEYGMEYDASAPASDYIPYYIRAGDRWSTTEPFVFGDPIDIVEIPFSWMLDDFPHFEFTPGWSSEQSSPSTVREIWQADFDYAYEHHPGGVFTVTMHPQVIGRGYRLRMLADFVAYMKQKPGVAFASIGDYATRWKAANPLAEWIVANPIQSGRSAITELEARRVRGVEE